MGRDTDAEVAPGGADDPRTPPQRSVELVLDTNVMLQCRPLRELPWQDVRPGENAFELLLTQTVVGELDRLKGDGNARRAKRARAACTQIDDLLAAVDETVVLRAARPRVVLRLAPPCRPDWNMFPNLDSGRPDHRLVAEALTLRRPGREMVLVSHDGGPRHAARHAGLAAFKVPDKDTDGWLLPPETDERDKEIERLKSELRSAKQSQPDITVRFENQDGSPLHSLDLHVMSIPDLEDAEVEALVAYTDTTEEKVRRFTTSGISQAAIEGLVGSGLVQPTAAEIEKFQNARAEFPKRLDTYFRRLPLYLGGPSRQQEFSLILTNNGQAPAENLLLEITALGGFLLAEKISGLPSLKLPEAPVPPAPRSASSAFGYGDLLGNLEHIARPYNQLDKSTRDIGPIRTTPREPTNFYWKDGIEIIRSQNVTYCSLTCEDFRHQRRDVTHLAVVIPRDANVTSGAVKVYVSARNLRKPVEVNLPVRVVKQNVDLLSLAEKNQIDPLALEALRVILKPERHANAPD